VASINAPCTLDLKERRRRCRKGTEKKGLNTDISQRRRLDPNSGDLTNIESPLRILYLWWSPWSTAAVHSGLSVNCETLNGGMHSSRFSWLGGHNAVISPCNANFQFPPAECSADDRLRYTVVTAALNTPPAKSSNHASAATIIIHRLLVHYTLHCSLLSCIQSWLHAFICVASIQCVHKKQSQLLFSVASSNRS